MRLSKMSCLMLIVCFLFGGSLAGVPGSESLLAAGGQRTGKILVILTGVDRIPGTEKETGFWAEEYAVPMQLFKKAGWKVFVATLKGGAAPVDARSLDPKVVGPKGAANVKKLLKKHQEFKKTVPLKGLLVHEFAAVFVVGGHGVMWDLTRAPEMADLVQKAVDSGVLISAVCHGPGALLGITLANGRKFLDGQAVTGFSAEEEEMAGMTGTVPYCLEAELNQESGGGFRKAGKPWESHVEKNPGLILGQNPASSEMTAQAVLEALSGK